MKKNKWMLTALSAFIILAGFIAVGFSSKPTVQQPEINKDNNSTCCQKMQKCKAKAGSSGEMIMDNLSRQFLTLFPLGH